MSASADGSPAETVAAAVNRAPSSEDQARADFYALLARLFADAPDAALLAAIAHAAPLGVEADIEPTEDAAPSLASAWDALRAASAAMDPDAVMEEYNDLFIGVGKSEVNLHASHWLTGFMMERPLVELREALDGLGLARQAGATMLEDHLAALCETMRILIAGQGARAPAPISAQRDFFERQIAPWAFSCCTAIIDSSVANYYRAVAQFSERYLALERDSFAID